MNEGAFADIAPHLLGDVVISVETCQREAQSAGISFEHHFTELLIHGILHLFGYDHEQSEEEEQRMATKSEELLLQSVSLDRQGLFAHFWWEKRGVPSQATRQALVIALEQ